ncbi:pyridoxamine 5'-phosphate oxidase family protein [Microbacterium invictum]
MTDAESPHLPGGDEDSSRFSLGEDECWALIEAAGLGRLAVIRSDGHPDIFPVNHHVHEGSILIRSARGSKLDIIAENPRVAFEVDGEDDASRWSVVVRGTAAQVTSEMELQRIGISQLASRTPTWKPFVVRIAADAVSGRRFDVSIETAGPVYAVPATGAIDISRSRSRADRPSPIPHFSPSRPNDGGTA